MDMLNTSSELRRLAWGLLVVAGIFAIGYLCGNLPWDQLLK